MKLLGYCMNRQGEYEEPVKIYNCDDISNFLITNVTKHYELRIVDTDDMIVFQVIDQQLVFPIIQENVSNRWNPKSQKFEPINVIAKLLNEVNTIPK